MPTLQELRTQIGQLRETKGQEQATLDLITRTIPQAESEQAWEDLANLYLEQHLTYQHLIMNQRDSATPDQSIISQNLDLMYQSTLKAHKVIADHQLESLNGTIHRFLGRCYTYQGKHDLAQVEYQQAVEILDNQNNPQSLEVNGFLAETLVYLNQPQAALDLAQATYAQFDSSPLKNSQPDIWAIWRSGIFIHLTRAFLKTNQAFDHDMFKKYLTESKNYLNSSHSYRLSEIENLLNQI